MRVIIWSYEAFASFQEASSAARLGFVARPLQVNRCSQR